MLSKWSCATAAAHSAHWTAKTKGVLESLYFARRCLMQSLLGLLESALLWPDRKQEVINKDNHADNKLWLIVLTNTEGC